MKINFNLDQQNLDKFIDEFNKNIDDSWSKTAKYIDNRINQHFVSSRSPSGDSWAPLALSTLINRRRLGVFHIKPLVVTGKMKNSLKVLKTKDQIKLTMDSPAIYHQYGTKNMPRRQIFPDLSNEADWALDISRFF